MNIDRKKIVDRIEWRINLVQDNNQAKYGAKKGSNIRARNDGYIAALKALLEEIKAGQFDAEAANG